MTNFIKRLVDGNSNKEGNCCGVEIKEVASENKEGASESCCNDTTGNSSSCCG